MTKDMYRVLEEYMLSCMDDSAHDREHIYRVLYNALRIAKRFRKSCPPQSIEAKILFDADKLDVTGAIGIARTLVYKGNVSEPLYSLLPDGTVSNGENDATPSFFQEYKYKLEKLYSKFYTVEGNKLAKERQGSAIAFFENMYEEVRRSYEKGNEELAELLQG